MAIEAELLCRLDGGSHHQSGSRTLHGQPHGSQDHRSKGKPPIADLPSRRHYQSDPGSCRTAGLTTRPARSWTERAYPCSSTTTSPTKVYYNKPDKDGHLAASEQPKLS